MTNSFVSQLHLNGYLNNSYHSFYPLGNDVRHLRDDVDSNLKGPNATLTSGVL